MQSSTDHTENSAHQPPQHRWVQSLINPILHPHHHPLLYSHISIFRKSIFIMRHLLCPFGRQREGPLTERQLISWYCICISLLRRFSVALMLGQDELHKCYANDSRDNAPTRSAHNRVLIILTLDLYPKALDGGHCFSGDPVKDPSMRVITPQWCQEFDCGSRKLDGPVKISQKKIEMGYPSSQFWHFSAAPRTVTQSPPLSSALCGHRRTPWP